MFDAIELPVEQPLHRADDAAVVAAIAGWARVEAQAAARRLAAVAELTVRRCEDGERADWACDDWDGAAAEVSAVLGVSHGRASGQMHEAMALRTRLPQVAGLFAAGTISARVAAAIAWRTNLVDDPKVARTIDAALADAAAGWDRLSRYTMDQVIDAVVDRHDPAAVRRTRAGARSRDVQVGGQNPHTATTALWGRLLTTDATVLHRRLTMMAHQVCGDDPRTRGQRRADALGALAAGSTELACQCGAGPACPAAGVDARAGAVVIHVLADTAAVSAVPDPLMSGEHPQMSAEHQPDAEPAAAPAGTAVIAGGPTVPPGLLAHLITAGATLRPMGQIPGSAETRYRPSAALDEFIRMRDLTCRFPNCDVPAQHCDIDHRIPWPAGPTHPANLRCLCRKHHLLRTFAGGPHGWRDVQLPDATIIWTAPTGHTYTTIPASRLWFPTWNTTTTPLPDHPTPDHPTPDQPIPEHPDRTLAAPRRRRTRTAERTHHIRSQRALNNTHTAERTRPPPF